MRRPLNGLLTLLLTYTRARWRTPPRSREPGAVAACGIPRRHRATIAALVLLCSEKTKPGEIMCTMRILAQCPRREGRGSLVRARLRRPLITTLPPRPDEAARPKMAS